MKQELAEKIVDQLQNMGIDAEMRDDYSGRGMFGKITAGIVMDAKYGPLIGFAYALAIANEADMDGGDVADTLNNTIAGNDLPRNIDSMGLSAIFY